MIVDVTNLDLAALRCYIFYSASSIALSEEYGFHCNVEEYEQNMENGLRYLFLAENCADNLTTSIFCSIEEFIDDLKLSTLYKNKSAEDCSDQPTDPFCNLTISDDATTCSDSLTLNILQ